MNLFLRYYCDFKWLIAVHVFSDSSFSSFYHRMYLIFPLDLTERSKSWFFNIFVSLNVASYFFVFFWPSAVSFYFSNIWLFFWPFVVIWFPFLILKTLFQENISINGIKNDSLVMKIQLYIFQKFFLYPAFYADCSH